MKLWQTLLHIDTSNKIKAYFIRHKIKYGYALTKNLFVEYKKQPSKFNRRNSNEKKEAKLFQKLINYEVMRLLNNKICILY